MGFYGNITNTSKTTFAFDKTYANRYEMDMSCGSDEVMSGRYVLIEYDQDQSEDCYPAYFYYNGVMYFEENVDVTSVTDITIFLGVQSGLKHEGTSGEIVKVNSGNGITNFNDEPEYIQIVDNTGTFKYITKQAYQNYLDNTYRTLSISSDNYVGGKLYVHTQPYKQLLNATIDDYRLELEYPQVAYVMNDYKNESEFDSEEWPSETKTNMLSIFYKHVGENGATLDSIPSEGVFYWKVEENNITYYAPLANITSLTFTDPTTQETRTWESWWKGNNCSSRPS